MNWNGSIGFVALCVSGLVACSGTDSTSSTASPEDESARGTETNNEGAPLEGPRSSADTTGAASDTNAEPAGETSGEEGSAAKANPAILAGCALYPADNPWNRDVSADPVDTDAMSRVMPNMHPAAALHADWGTRKEGFGMPITVVNGGARRPMSFVASWGPSESDQQGGCSGSKFCYPIPANALIEGGSGAPHAADRHVLVLDTAGAPNNCTLYELYHSFPNGSGWTADNGAIFHLGSNALRTDGWTSGDAAGLPILPGLVRFDEAMSGVINHAIRFTMNNTFNGYIHPATHAAGRGKNSLPPMGMRMRLKANVDVSKFTGPMRAVAVAMKKYGVILADNGSNWYISGESNDSWGSQMDTVTSQLHKLHGGDFEIVKSGSVSTKGL